MNKDKKHKKKISKADTSDPNPEITARKTQICHFLCVRKIYRRHIPEMNPSILQLCAVIYPDTYISTATEILHKSVTSSQ